mmetsp:Transcript_20929/g.45768  ORF Transcript_20929/g.45768 Transcript_20929/m.45768 type:complete len:160 (-) Transcript_20929:1204-1683(-)
MEKDDTSAKQMWLYSSVHATLWFKQWETTNTFTYFVTLLGLVLFAVLHEWISSCRSRYSKRMFSKPEYDEEAAPLATAGHKQDAHTSLRQRAGLAGLYTLNISTGYLLMLAVMTYNVGYLFAVLGGLGLGHLLFMDPADGGSSGVQCNKCQVRLLDVHR